MNGLDEQIVRLVLEIDEHEKNYMELKQSAGRSVKGYASEERYLREAELEKEAIDRKVNLIKILKGV